MRRAMGHSGHRGAALLIVLAILLMTTASIVVLAQRASTASLQRHMARDAVNADAVLLAANDIILEWLKKESSSVVLPPEATAPRVNVVNEQLRFDDQLVTLRITAFDQSGMTPMNAVRDGSPLRLVLPDEVLRVVQRTDIPREATVGLDLLTIDDSELFRYPKSDNSSPMNYTSSSTANSNVAARESHRTLDSQPESLCIGEYIATHNPGDGTRQPSVPGIINVNTAPMPLVERALLIAGRGGLELIEQQRRSGKVGALNDLPSQREDSAAIQSNLQIVGSSTSWSFRIDITVGLVHEAWWFVYLRTRSQWQRVQGLLIDE